MRANLIASFCSTYEVKLVMIFQTSNSNRRTRFFTMFS